ncbi:MAG: sigma-70 family RNA polymerase sigma factor [Solirubrobacteraceae bacterium]
MSLAQVRDEFLAARAARGDEVAFAALARRYRGLLGTATRYYAAGVDADDLRQAALIGLYFACRSFDPGHGCRFAGWARRCVRQAILNALRWPGGRRQRVLTDALHDGEDVTRQLEHRVAAPAGSDPAVVVALRDELRERVHASRRRVDRRRRYSDEQVRRALALIAAGKTLKETGWAVGAPPGRVACWVRRAGQPRPGGRRRYSRTEIDHALALVHTGASLRQAGAAVGATNAIVLRWIRKAA